MEDSVIQRVIRVMKYKQVSVNRFSKEIGIAQTTLSNYILGKRKASFELVESIAKRYDDISGTWLLTGEGDMLVGNGVSGSYVGTKPRLPITAAAGAISEYIGGIYKERCEQIPTVHAFPSYDFTIIVKGDSMEPKYEGGDEVACKKVENIIEWGKTYVVDTNDGAFLKRVYDEDEQNIRCVSYNSDYHDFLVPKSEVNGLYRVVGLLRF